MDDNWFKFPEPSPRNKIDDNIIKTAKEVMDMWGISEGELILRVTYGLPAYRRDGYCGYRQSRKGGGKNEK